MADNLEGDIINLLDNMPEPSENIDTDTPQEAVDSFGTVFDGEMHSIGPDGKPTLTKAGRWRKKKGGASRPRANSVDASEIASRATGAGMAESIFALGQLLGGEEWVPIVDENLGINERVTMYDAFTAYVKAKNISDVPAGVALSIALLAYAAPRFAMPKTKSRFSSIKGWIAGRWIKWRS